MRKKQIGKILRKNLVMKVVAGKQMILWRMLNSLMQLTKEDFSQQKEKEYYRTKQMMFNKQLKKLSKVSIPFSNKILVRKVWKMKVTLDLRKIVVIIIIKLMFS